MAIYRNIQMTFWTDTKIADEFTPEDKYFYLYLMTNPHTNLCGCYELSLTQAANETGYNKETISRLLNRMEDVHNVIRYSKETKEVLILNWSKYNWTRSKDFQKPLISEIENVKDADFMEFLDNELETIKTVLPPSQDPDGTTDTDTVTVDENINKSVKEIINYLNETTGSRYKPNTEKNKKHIVARLNEGFTVADMKLVIDKKYDEWKGTEWEKFVRPETLFGGKFEGYLNQKIIKKKSGSQMDSIVY